MTTWGDSGDQVIGVMGRRGVDFLGVALEQMICCQWNMASCVSPYTFSENFVPLPYNSVAFLFNGVVCCFAAFHSALFVLAASPFMCCSAKCTSRPYSNNLSSLQPWLTLGSRSSPANGFANYSTAGSRQRSQPPQTLHPV